MLSRRQSAIVELLASAATLAAAIAAKRGFVEDDEHALDLIAAGAVLSVVHQALYDRDVGGVRESRVRRSLFVGAWALAADRFLPNDDIAGIDFSIGTSLGTLAYRLWYGVVRPLPE